MRSLTQGQLLRRIDGFFAVFTPLLAAAAATALVMFAKRAPWELRLDPHKPYWEARGDRASYRLFALKSDTLSDRYRDAAYSVDSRLEVDGINGWNLVSVRWDSIRYGTRRYRYWKTFPVAVLTRDRRVREDSTYFFEITRWVNQPPHVRPVIRQIREIGGAI